MTGGFVSRAHKQLQAVLAAGVLVATPAWGASLDEMREHYRELTENVATNPFRAPLSVASTETAERVTAEVFGVFDAPFAEVARAIAEPARVCDFISLNIFIKACTWKAANAPTEMTWFMGRKDYATPDADSVVSYSYNIDARTSEAVQVTLRAPEAMMGVTDSSIVFNALSIDGRTLIHVQAGYTPSLQSRMAIGTYLATFGRNKIGFTTQPGADGRAVPVKGAQALIERNTMRYFLALQAYLDTRALPVEQHESASIARWFELTERYHDVLYEIPREQYIENKTRERENSVKLQADLLSHSRADPVPAKAGAGNQ